MNDDKMKENKAINSFDLSIKREKNKTKKMMNYFLYRHNLLISTLIHHSI